ncbi:MAG: Fimbrial assembly family protein [Frankiales bacterium]|nr:Fimbrial assembly family protein [Frankiales bacterium]
MTVLNTEARLGMTTGQMPRVNLLPPEIAETALFRKVQLGLGGAVLGAVVVVGLLAASAAHGVSTAQTKLDGETAKNSSLSKDVASYSNVTAVYNAAAAAQLQLTNAMGQEVRYSQLMHDLSLSVPSSVWLKTLTFNQTPPAATAGAAAAPGIGTVAFTGVGFSHDDLALWLEAMANLKTYSDPYFASSTESLLGTKKIVTFSGTMNETGNALSGRYSKLGG